MLRTLVLALLLGNALLVAAQFGAFDQLLGSNHGRSQQREPERLQQQVRPEALKVLPPQAASAALAEAAAAAAAAAAPYCVEAGPWGAPDAEAAEKALRDAGLAAGSWQVRRSEGNGLFMVYMGKHPSREVTLRKLEEVHRRNLEAEEIRNQPELQPGLNLGKFATRAEADAAHQAMMRRGVRTAKVIALKPPQPLATLRFVAADAALRTRLQAVKLPAGASFGTCPDLPPPPPRPASAALAPDAVSAAPSAASAAAPASTAKR